MKRGKKYLWKFKNKKRLKRAINFSKLNILLRNEWNKRNLHTFKTNNKLQTYHDYSWHLIWLITIYFILRRPGINFAAVNFRILF